jgi:hypothetical protein
MDNLTIVLILVLVILAYLVYRHHENLEDGSGSKCVKSEINKYQTNEVNYNGSDVESSYFNQLERNKTWNERQSWLNNMQVEAQRQSTHTCILE